MRKIRKNRNKEVKPVIIMDIITLSRLTNLALDKQINEYIKSLPKESINLAFIS